MSKPKTVFHGVNLVARDMKATLAFYRELGVDIPGSAVWGEDGGHHVSVPGQPADLDLDSEKLAAVYNAGFSPDGSSRCLIGFGLPTREAVDERYAALTAAGHKGLQPPWDAFWGSRAAVVEDPDGNHVGLMSPPDPDKRRAPPDL